MKKIIDNKIDSKEDAVRYVNTNLKDLQNNLNNVAEDVIRAYADLKEFPISIDAISKDDYMIHQDKILYSRLLIEKCQSYLSAIDDKLSDYYKPDDYMSKITEDIKRDIDSHLSDYVDEFSHDVDVKYPDDDLSTAFQDTGFMVLDDGKIKSVRHFL